MNFFPLLKLVLRSKYFPRFLKDPDLDENHFYSAKPYKKDVSPLHLNEEVIRLILRLEKDA